MPRRIVDRVALGKVPDGVTPRPMHWWCGSRQVGVGAIRLYQRRISPRLPTRCRYVPTCSAYGLEAVRSYGLLLGSRLALGRIHRCTRDVTHGTRDLVRA
ncbi:membrane protein insertion efficiency factor YidD [Myceligenerans halotolerans]